MASVNKIFLLGNLGRDPEVRFTPSGQAVAKFSLATSRRWKDKDGAKQEKTEWHNIVVWGKMAEIVGQYLTKGRSAFIEGEVQYRTYDAQDGTKKYITEVNARDIQFVGGREGVGVVGNGTSAGEDIDASSTQPDGDAPVNQESIPF